MAHTEHVTEETEPKAISLRDVDPIVWKDFKRLAAVHDMTLQQLLKYLVDKEKADVRLDLK
jgi:macrodomain Ter protein organizer (MatP/YcbG family)